MFCLSLGSSIQACRASRRHVLAFEEDTAIFDSLIAPVMRSTRVTRPAATVPAVLSMDEDDEDVEPDRVVKTARFSK